MILGTLDTPVTVFTAIAAIGFGVVAYIVVNLANEKQPVEKTEKAAKSSHRRFDDAYDGSPMLRRAIEVTANLAERRGLLGSVERSLRAADIPMRPAEVLFAYGIVAVVVPVSSRPRLEFAPRYAFVATKFAARPEGCELPPPSAPGVVRNVPANWTSILGTV